MTERTLKLKDLKDPNTLKCVLCGIIPFGIILCLEAEWIKIVAPKLEMFNSTSAHFDPVIIIALAFGMVAPIWLAIRFVDLGFYLGKKLHIYKLDEQPNDEAVN